MTLHQVDFEYKLPEWGTMEIDLDETLSSIDKEDQARTVIMNAYEDIESIEITKIKVME